MAAGYDTVQRAAADPVLADLALRFMLEEQMSAQPPVISMTPVRRKDARKTMASRLPGDPQ